MIKTIKVKKKMRLDELIKYVWDNNEIFKGRTHIKFTSNSNCPVIFGVYGHFETDYGHDADDTFTVEVEEPITEDTEFQTLVAADAEGDACLMYKGTIDEIRDSITTEIYANINGKLQLIWEAESDE